MPVWEAPRVAFVVGVLVGLSGVGAAALMTPFLVLFLGVSPATAVGTDLVYSAITKAFGSYFYYQKRSADLRVVFSLAMGSIPAALARSLLLRWYQKTAPVHR